MSKNFPIFIRCFDGKHIENITEYMCVILFPILFWLPFSSVNMVPANCSIEFEASKQICLDTDI